MHAIFGATVLLLAVTAAMYPAALAWAVVGAIVTTGTWIVLAHRRSGAGPGTGYVGSLGSDVTGTTAYTDSSHHHAGSCVDSSAGDSSCDGGSDGGGGDSGS